MPGARRRQRPPRPSWVSVESVARGGVPTVPGRLCVALAVARATRAGTSAGRDRRAGRAGKAGSVARGRAQSSARAQPQCRWRGRRRRGRNRKMKPDIRHAADVLLVDDDPDLLKLISLRLTSAGYHVRTADSGETALAGLAVARPGAVITDLRMPGIDGLQLFEAIHREHPALPVIILTAHGTIPDAVAATQRGVFGFLTKPFDSQELLQKVAGALRVAGDSPLDSASTTGEWRAGIITRSR